MRKVLLVLGTVCLFALPILALDFMPQEQRVGIATMVAIAGIMMLGASMMGTHAPDD